MRLVKVSLWGPAITPRFTPSIFLNSQPRQFRRRLKQPCTQPLDVQFQVLKLTSSVRLPVSLLGRWKLGCLTTVNNELEDCVL